MSSPIAGWYYTGDEAPGRRRYWNGTNWSGSDVPVRMGESEAVLASGFSIASPVVRFAARFIDWLVWLALYLVAYLAVDGVTSSADSYRRAGYIAVFSVMVAIYESSLLSAKGSTWGKRLFGLEVVEVQEDFAMNPTMGAAFKRILLLLIAMLAVAVVFAFLDSGFGTLAFVVLVLSLGIHGIFAAYSSSNNQTTWDSFSSTMVVTAND